MEHMWAPWRIEYILGPKPDTCVFCIPEHREEDEERQILYRGEKNFIIMNKYPYNVGHIMVMPYEHTDCLTKLSTDVTHELMDLLQVSTTILRETFNPTGINIGLNLGTSAGAGIREHLHYHLVPRWDGDSSFMATCADVRLISEHLQETYAKLKPKFDSLPQGM